MVTPTSGVIANNGGAFGQPVQTPQVFDSASLALVGGGGGVILSSQISDFAEAVDDRVAQLLIQGAGILLSYNDPGNGLTISAPTAGILWSVTPIKTANYVAQPNEYVRVNATGGDVAITLPTTAGAPCCVEKIEADTSTNQVIVLQGGGAQSTMFQPGHARGSIGNGTTADLVWDRKPFGYEDFLDVVTHTGASYTLGIGDGQVHEMNSATAQTLNIPAFASVAWRDGTTREIYQRGAGQTSLVHAISSAHFEGKGTKTNGQGSTMGLRYRASGDIWVVSGDVTT